MWKALPAALLLAASASADPTPQVRVETLLGDVSGKAASLYAAAEGEAAGAEYKAKEKERLAFDERLRLAEADLGTLITRTRTAASQAGLPRYLEKSRAELRFWRELSAHDVRLARWQSLAAPPRDEALRGCDAAAAFVEAAVAEDSASPVDPRRNGTLETLAVRVSMRVADLRARLAVEAGPPQAAAPVRVPGRPAVPEAPAAGENSEAAYRALFDGETSRRASEPDELSRLGDLPVDGAALPPALGRGPMLVSGARLKIQEAFLKADAGALDAIDRLADDAMRELRVEEGESRRGRRATSESREWFERAHEELRLLARNAREAKDASTLQEKEALLSSLYRRLDQIYADGDRSLKPPESEYRSAMAKYLQSGGGRPGLEAQDAVTRLEAALAAYRANPGDAAAAARLRDIFIKSGERLKDWERDDPQALYEFLYKMHGAREALTRDARQEEAWAPVLDAFDRRLSQFVALKAKEPGRPQVSGAPSRALTIAFAETLSFFPETAGAARRAAADERLDQASGEAAAAAAPVLALVPEASRAALERDRAEALAIKDSALRAERVGAVVDRALEAARANPELAPALDAPRLALEARRAYEAKAADAAKVLSESADARDGLARLAQAPPARRAEAMEELRASLGGKDAAALDTVVAASLALREELAGIELRQAEVHAAHPELGALMLAAARADGASLDFVRSGDAPAGTVATIEGPRGRVEARAGPWLFKPRDELGWPDAPFPLDEYLRSAHGSVSGWHELSPGRREFRSHDGRLRIVVEESADGETRRFLLDGRFAGSLVKKAGADPKLESADPDHPHVVLLGRGDRSREPHAWIDLAHLETVTDAADRKAAIGELARELSSFLGSDDPSAMESFLLHQLTEPRGKPSLILQRQRRQPGAEIDLRFEEKGHLRLVALWHDADKPRRIEGSLTLAGPGGRDARRVAQLAYEPGIYETTMDENHDESNPISLQMGTRALTERFALDGGKQGALSGAPTRGPFKPHTDVNRLWVDVAGAGLETVGTILQELGAQVRYVAVDPLAAVVVGVSGDGWRGFDRVMLDSESNHNNTPLNRWLQKQTGLNYAADQWSMMSKEQRDIYADRAARKGLTGPHAAYLEYRNAGTPAEQNMALARQAQARANATGSAWDQAAAYAFTGVAVGAQVGEGFLGSFAAGGMVQGVGKLLPQFGRALGIGMEAADMADTAQSLAQIPAHLLSLNLKNPDSVAALTMALVDLEGVVDVMGGAGKVVDPGRVQKPGAPAAAAPNAAPDAPAVRERSAAPEAAPAPMRARLKLDGDPMLGRDNIIPGSFDGTPVVVKLNATGTEFANQQRARSELAAAGVGNVHVPLALRGVDTDAFLDKAFDAMPADGDGGAFAKIGGEVLREFQGRQTVISERLPDGAVSLRDVLSGKAKIDPVSAADLDGLKAAGLALHKAGLQNSFDPGNVFLRQGPDGRTHFHILGWGGVRSATPMGDAVNGVWDGLVGMNLAPQRGAGTGGPSTVKPGSLIPADPERAREIRDARSRRPPIEALVKRYLGGTEQLGFVKDEKTPQQGQQGDCATRSLYNHPLSEGIRRTMSYRTFHDLVAAVAKKKYGIETIDDGLTPQEQSVLAHEFGFRINHAPDIVAGDDLARRLQFENMGVRASIGWRDAGETGPGGRHAVVVEGAFKEKGEWQFVVRDPHKPTPYLFTWADLRVLGVEVYEMMPNEQRMSRGEMGPEGAAKRAMALLGEFDVVAPAADWGKRYANPEAARRAASRERELYGKIVALATELGVPNNPDDAGKIFKAVQVGPERTAWGQQVWGSGRYELGPQEMMRGIREGKYDAAYFARLNLDGPKARLLELVYARESLMSPTAALGGADAKTGNRSAPARSRLMGEIAKLFEEQDAAGGAVTGAEIPIPTQADIDAAARPVRDGADGSRNKYGGLRPMDGQGKLTGRPAEAVYTREIVQGGKKVKEFLTLEQMVQWEKRGQSDAVKDAYRRELETKARQLRRQNEAAEILARHGFDVDRLGGESQPEIDYVLRDASGRRFEFDCRSAESNRLEHIHQGIVNKNGDGKHRQVVSLVDVSFTPAQVAEALRQRPVPGLVEILFIAQDGSVHHYNPSGILRRLSPR